MVNSSLDECPSGTFGRSEWKKYVSVLSGAAGKALKVVGATRRGFVSTGTDKSISCEFDDEVDCDDDGEIGVLLLFGTFERVVVVVVLPDNFVLNGALVKTSFDVWLPALPVTFAPGGYDSECGNFCLKLYVESTAEEKRTRVNFPKDRTFYSLELLDVGTERRRSAVCRRRYSLDRTRKCSDRRSSSTTVRSMFADVFAWANDGRGETAREETDCQDRPKRTNGFDYFVHSECVCSPAKHCSWRCR